MVQAPLLFFFFLALIIVQFPALAYRTAPNLSLTAQFGLHLDIDCRRCSPVQDSARARVLVALTKRRFTGTCADHAHTEAPYVANYAMNQSRARVKARCSIESSRSHWMCFSCSRFHRCVLLRCVLALPL